METAETYSVILENPEGADRGLIVHILEEHFHTVHIEAVMSAKNTWGFLAAGISKDEAYSLEKTCIKNGVSALSVPGTSIVTLPKTEECIRFDCLPSELIYTIKIRPGPDGKLSQTVSAQWEDVIAVCSAPVPEESSTLVKHSTGPSDLDNIASGVLTVFTALPIRIGKKKDTVKKVVETNIVNYTEIFLKNPFRRLKLKSDKLDYAYLGTRNTFSSITNYRLLLGDLGKSATNAFKNHGLTSILKNVTFSLIGYNSYKNFEKESIWLLTLYNLKNGISRT